MSQIKSVTIAGAGLVGSLWAVMLRQRGFEVSLYEKLSDPRLSPVAQGRSINLVITSRGLNALKKAGLLKEIIATTVPVFGRMIHPIKGDCAYQAYGKASECNYSVSRYNLNNSLLDAAEKMGVKLFFDHKLEGVDFSKKNLKFSNESKQIFVDYNLLFGADGAGSVVRHEMIKFLKDENLEKTNWLEADYKELHLPANADGTPKLKKDALHIWPRGTHMLMALANQDGSSTLTLYLPKKGPISFENVQSENQVSELFNSQFPDLVPILPAHYVKEFITNPQGRLGTIHCQKWVANNAAVLLGDAAHAIIPFFGQGMNSGFEDCTTLLDLLDSNNKDWALAFQSYDNTRHASTDAIATMALENWGEMRDKVGDPQFLLRKKVEGWLEEQFPKFYKSRYGMITYTLISYAAAQEAGFIQDRLLAELCKDISSPQDISREKAEKLLEKELIPFLKKNNLSLENFKIPNE